MGPATAPVTITVFSDFQCPYCARFASALAQILDKYPMEVRAVFRNFPLKIHPQATHAAVAAGCAAKQGRFRQFHDFLFQHQDSLAHTDYVAVALHTGVRDTSAFTKCLAADEIAMWIRADSTDAVRLGVRGTPTVLINQWLTPGTPTFEQLEGQVTALLKKRR